MHRFIERVLFVWDNNPSAISMDAIYNKSSLGRPFLAHCNWFCHVGYDKGLHPTPYYNDKHEQVKFILNIIDFKVPILYYFQFAFFQFLVLCICIEIEVFFQFCFKPPSLSNLIMSNQVWCMTSFASKTSRWFHWSNSRMSYFLMSTKDGKQLPKGVVLFDKRIFFDYRYKVRFSPNFSIWICQLFSLRHVNYKKKSSWCNVKVFAQYSNLV